MDDRTQATGKVKIHRGQGLITQILTRPDASNAAPMFRLNHDRIVSKYDQEFLRRLLVLAEKKKAAGSLNRKELREYRHVIRKMEDRGLLTWDQDQT